MLRSMTGYGRSLLEQADWHQLWEIRSVNGKHLDIKWRLPRLLHHPETSWEGLVRQHVSRARVNIELTLHITRPDILAPRFNTALAEAMYKELQDFAKTTGHTFQPNPAQLINMHSLWEDTSRTPDTNLTSGLEKGLLSALENWNTARTAEARTLQKDMKKRTAHLGELLAALTDRAPHIKHERFTAVSKRVQHLLDTVSVQADESRMLQETALLADKLDVSEELTRLEAHLQTFTEALQGNSPAGKRLDFLLQELFREINTCGNKAQDIEASRLVVEFKTELEKIREQVQNIE